MNFDSLTLKAWRLENYDFLINSRLQKIAQPTRREFILQFRNFGKTRKLYININPQIYYLCFIEDSYIDRRLIIPQKPPMFCMLLRKYLEGARVIDVSVPSYERILELKFEAYNELSERVELVLAIELMGKHSNVILYNNMDKIIIGCAHNVGEEKSRAREMAGTLPYIYPPKAEKKDILQYFGDINYQTLSEDFYGFSKPFAQMCKGVDIETLKDYIELKKITPVISKDKYSLFKELLPTSEIQNSVNSMIDNYFGNLQYQHIKKNIINRLNALNDTKLKKAKVSLDKMKSQISDESKLQKYKKYGTLLMGNLYLLKDFQEEVSVFDYESELDITIKLDATKSIKDNANRYFKLYNKYKTANEKLQEFINKAQEEIVYLESVKYSIQIAETLDELEDIESELGLTPQQKNKITKQNNNIDKINIDGFSIYIGKNNKQNDYIVSKLAKDNDIWLHTKDCAGSHILVKVTDNNEPSDNVIFECAKLAKNFSSGSKSSKIGVIYTKAKNLKKPPAAALGYVTYKNEQEIIID